MNTLEMLGKLVENPKRKAKAAGSDFIWEVDGYGFVLNFNVDDERQWEIIEPQRKLKEMCFGEAYREWVLSNNQDARSMRSVLSGLDFSRSMREIPKEEMMGKWTYEGVYEDEGGAE
jgi:hypothetical protein